MIEEKLRAIGFNENEIHIYLSLIRLKKATHARLSKDTGIKRSTVYGVIDSLLDKGVIAQDLAEKVTYLIALTPKNLLAYIEQKKRRLAKEEEIAYEAIQEISALTPSSAAYSVPKIKFVEERNLRDFLYNNSLTWAQNTIATQSSGWGFQDHTFYEHYKDWFKWFWEKAPERFNVHSYINKNPQAEEKETILKDPRRHVQLWPKKTNFTGTVWVEGDYLILVVTGSKPHYLVEIHDAVLAHNMREYFKNTWKQEKDAK